MPRPRLVARLEEGLAGGLVVVCAPAGSGKTALLDDWARRGGWPAAWLSPDVGDNDPARFWRHVVAALGQVRPGARISGAGGCCSRKTAQALTLPARVLAQAATGGRIGNVIEIRAAGPSA